jgi:hypothetical protein
MLSLHQQGLVRLLDGVQRLLQKRGQVDGGAVEIFQGGGGAQVGEG